MILLMTMPLPSTLPPISHDGMEDHVLYRILEETVEKKPFGKNPSPTNHSSTQLLPSTQVSAKFSTSASPSTSYTTVSLTMQFG